jgi:hypothetical protein
MVLRFLAFFYDFKTGVDNFKIINGFFILKLHVMSNAEDLLAVRDDLLAIPTEKVHEPTLPVGIFVQEAENLAQWSADDLPQLTTVGITSEKLDAIKVRAGALRETQSLWNKDRRSMQDAQKQWATESPAAYDLRDELLHTFRYAFRSDDQLLGRVAEIADGTGHADMLQDLNDLAVLGRENPELLAAIGFDAAKLETAATLSDTLAEVLAQANGDKLGDNEAKVLRDRAFTFLKEVVDETRNAGKYLFWKTPERIKGYYSEFWRKKNAAQVRASASDEVPDTEN